MAARPGLRRRSFLTGLVACGLCPARAEGRRFRIAFANLDETPGVTLEGLGFTSLELRRSFELAARTLPVDMLYFDNAGDPARSVANADAAIAAKVDLLIEYNADAEANAEIARRLSAAAIPALALVNPLPGVPVYGPDNRAAGRLAGQALGVFALETWPNEEVLGVLIGDLADPGPAIADRVQGITEGVHETLPGLQLASLDTGGQSVRADALLTKFLPTQRGRRLLIATLDDLAAVYAKNAIEMNRRQSDCVIVSQGLDRNIHGGASEKKEIDPHNRGSVVLGSVAYYIDRYGYDVLPLALRLLAGEKLPRRTVTQHKLITATDVFREYPPFDMN
ncbi:MAG TPA: substrate-binding domain-containing protein [Candidatus Dormibacteraeota bacterium]|nr:substrate-binding domain-containing protein [Candidatus Dormibacteraeota bacterium]